MRLLFTGTTSIWLILFLLIAVCVYTILIYSRHLLPKPWSFWLPAMRIASLMLLVLTLLQPVISKVWTVNVRGKIPIVVDNSGSMSITDSYTPADIVDIGWNFKFFPIALRNMVFTDEQKVFENVDRELVKLIASKSNPGQHAVTVLSGQIVKSMAKIDSSIKKSDYLRKRNKGGSELFSKSYAAVVKATRIIQVKFKQVEKLLKSEKNLKKNVVAARKIMRDISKLLREQASELLRLQRNADNLLGLSGNKKIAEAAEKIKKMNRMEIVEFLLTQEPFNILNELKKIGDVEIVLMNQPLVAVGDCAKLPGKDFLPTTRLGSVLYDVSNRYGKQPISGIFLFSDGQINSGKSLLEIKEIFRERRIPLYSVGIGRKEPPRDICIEKVFAPISSYKDDKLNVKILIQRNGFEKETFKLTLECEGKKLKEQLIPPGLDSTITVDLSFLEKESGLRHYEIIAENKDGEILKNNNSKTFSVNILTDPVKVLLVEEFPRWESRYLNMMLKRDVRINLETIFIASSEDGKLKIADKVGCFPATRDKMFAYDVIILGDVDPVCFNTGQLRNLRDFVLERGGVLITMAGSNYMPEAYRDTPIKDILPFQIKPKQIYQEDEEKEGQVVAAKVPIALNELAMYEDIVRIGDTPESTFQLWKNLPKMNWVKSGVYPTKNAETLVKSTKEKLPVLLTAYAGLGKVLYIGTDSFWRWRKYVRWKYHHRMWGQIIMWATLGKTTGADKHVKLMTDRPVYSPDETITFKARVLDKDEKAMESATLSAGIYNSDGKMVKNVRFISIPNSGGEYRAKVKGLPKGKYKVVPKVLELADVAINADYKFEVKDIATSEYIKLSLNERNLNSVSNEYQFFPMAGKLVDKIPAINKIEEKKQDYDLWDSFYLMILVAILLAVEWSIRKKIKLV